MNPRQPQPLQASGINKIEAMIDNGAWTVINSPLFFADGNHSYQIRVTDNAGNVTETPVQTLYIDASPAVIAMLDDALVLGDGLFYSIEDSQSGLTELRVVIKDNEGKYQRVTWVENLDGNSKYKGSMRWDGIFSDGTYPTPGIYYIALKVINGAGVETIGTATIEVPVVKTAEQESIPALVMPALETVETVIEEETVVTQSAPQVFGSTSNPFTGNSIQTSFSANSTTTPTQSNTTSNVLWGGVAAAALGAYLADQQYKRKQNGLKNQLFDSIKMNISAIEDSKKGLPADLYLNTALPMSYTEIMQRTQQNFEDTKEQSGDTPGFLENLLGLVASGLEVKEALPTVTTALRRLETAYRNAPPSLSQIELFNQTLVRYLTYDPSLPVPKSGVAYDVLKTPFLDVFGRTPSDLELANYENLRLYRNGIITSNQYAEIGEQLAIQQVDRSLLSVDDLKLFFKNTYNLTESGAGGIGALASIASLFTRGNETTSQNLAATGTTLGGWADLSQGLRGLSQIFNASTITQGVQDFATTVSPVARVLGVVGGGIQVLSSASRLGTEPQLQEASNERTGVVLQFLGGGLLMVGSAVLLLGTLPALAVLVPIGLVVGVIGLAVEHWDTITAATQESLQVWKNNFKQGREIIQKLSDIARNRIAENVERTGNQTANIITEAGNNLANKVVKFTEKASQQVSQVAESVANKVQNVSKTAATIVSNLGDKAAKVVNNAANSIANLIKPISPNASATIQKIGQTASNAVTNTTQSVSNAVQKIGQSTANKISSAGQTASITINKVGQTTAKVIQNVSQKAASTVKSMASSISKWFKKP